MKRHFDLVSADGQVFTHADLVHDMRLSVARALDPLSAYAYALVNKENYFLIFGSSLFDGDRPHGWDGTTIVGSPLAVTWARLALAPLPYFKKCVAICAPDLRTGFRMKTYFTCILLVSDDASPDFQARFECLVDAARLHGMSDFANNRADADLLRCAIGWGNYSIAEYIATYPNIASLGLAQTETLEAWHQRDFLGLGWLLSEAVVHNHTYISEFYAFVKETKGSPVPLLSQFARFCEAIGYPRLLAMCSCLWNAKIEDLALVLKPSIMDKFHAEKHLYPPLEVLVQQLPDSVALIAKRASTKGFFSSQNARVHTANVLEALHVWADH